MALIPWEDRGHESHTSTQWLCTLGKVARQGVKGTRLASKHWGLVLAQLIPKGGDPITFWISVVLSLEARGYNRFLSELSHLHYSEGQSPNDRSIKMKGKDWNRDEQRESPALVWSNSSLDREARMDRFLHPESRLQAFSKDIMVESCSLSPPWSHLTLSPGLIPFFNWSMQWPK